MILHYINSIFTFTFTSAAILCVAWCYAQLRRLKALCEVARLLRVGGRALVYVWAVEQVKDSVRSKYLRPSKTCVDSELGMVPAAAGETLNLPVHVNGTSFKAQDVLVPWHLKTGSGVAVRELSADGSSAGARVESREVVHRYYHTFVDGELQRLCGLVAGVQVVSSYYDQGNWCVIVERTVDVEVSV